MAEHVQRKRMLPMEPQRAAKKEGGKGRKGRAAHHEDAGVVGKARGSPETTNCGGNRRPAARKMMTIRRTEGVLAGAT
jgi:hypothetical protein